MVSPHTCTPARTPPGVLVEGEPPDEHPGNRRPRTMERGRPMLAGLTSMSCRSAHPQIRLWWRAWLPS